MSFPKKCWSSSQIHHHKEKQNTMLLCKDCRASGKMPHDVVLYTCDQCQSHVGCGKFDIKSLGNWKSRPGSRLTCKQCDTTTHARVVELHRRLRESKMICKCFCPIHGDRCPLNLIYYGEKRWPGADGHISWFDAALLNSLKPTPKWWARAWGRPEP